MIHFNSSFFDPKNKVKQQVDRPEAFVRTRTLVVTTCPAFETPLLRRIISSSIKGKFNEGLLSRTVYVSGLRSRSSGTRHDARHGYGRNPSAQPVQRHNKMGTDIYIYMLLHTTCTLNAFIHSDAAIQGAIAVLIAACMLAAHLHPHINRRRPILSSELQLFRTRILCSL